MKRSLVLIITLSLLLALSGIAYAEVNSYIFTQDWDGRIFAEGTADYTYYYNKIYPTQTWYGDDTYGWPTETVIRQSVFVQHVDDAIRPYMTYLSYNSNDQSFAGVDHYLNYDHPEEIRMIETGNNNWRVTLDWGMLSEDEVVAVDFKTKIRIPMGLTYWDWLNVNNETMHSATGVSNGHEINWLAAAVIFEPFWYYAGL